MLPLGSYEFKSNNRLLLLFLPALIVYPPAWNNSVAGNSIKTRLDSINSNSSNNNSSSNSNSSSSSRNGVIH